jgi:hypothetical protein
MGLLGNDDGAHDKSLQNLAREKSDKMALTRAGNSFWDWRGIFLDFEEREPNEFRHEDDTRIFHFVGEGLGSIAMALTLFRSFCFFSCMVSTRSLPRQHQVEGS